MEERLKKNAISDQEASILEHLEQQKTLSSCISVEITDLTHHAHVQDNDEVLRALYTLEGKSLVSPHPEGDFTSSQWKITDLGQKALKLTKQNLI